MTNYSWSQILLFFFAYCIMGWLFESVYVTIRDRRLSNRGFLRGPVVPIFGFGAIGIVTITVVYRGNYLAEFLSGMFAATIFEFLVSVAMEAVFKLRFWDYSRKPFQYKGRVCLQNAVCWGLLSLLAAEVLQVKLEELVFQLPLGVDTLMALLGVLLFVCDTVVSVRDAWGVRNMVLAMGKMKEDLEALYQDVETRSEEFIRQHEDAILARKTELDLDESVQRERLTREIAQLQKAIEKERRERELARAQFTLRVERDVAALQQKLEVEQKEFYDTLQIRWAEHADQKVRLVGKANLLLRRMVDNEEALYRQFQTRGRILYRYPNVKFGTTGSLRKQIERLHQRRKMQDDFMRKIR